MGKVRVICARDCCNMNEYNENPLATAQTIDTDGWLETGEYGDR